MLGNQALTWACCWKGRGIVNLLDLGVPRASSSHPAAVRARPAHYPGALDAVPGGDHLPTGKTLAPVVIVGVQCRIIVAPGDRFRLVGRMCSNKMHRAEEPRPYCTGSSPWHPSP